MNFRPEFVVGSIILPLIIAALTGQYGSSPIFAVVFLGLAIAIGLFWAARAIRGLFQGRKIQLALSRDEAVDAFHSIYKLAKAKGGVLKASHVAPLERVTRPDDAPDLLKDSLMDITYERIIFIDDPILQDRWIRHTLGIAKDNIHVTVFYCANNAFVPRFVWRIIPRINLLLYKGLDSKETRILIGLHRIYTEETVAPGQYQRRTPNFAVIFSEGRIFTHISQYFDAVVHGGVFEKVAGVDEYDRKCRGLLFQAKLRSFISRMLAICSGNPQILHASVFGYSAVYQQGVEYLDEFKTDVDVDLIIVCTRSHKEVVREYIRKSKLLSEENTFPFNIIWGDDPNEFYSLRESGGFAIDLELFEEGDEFFRQHPLLGHSILSSCSAVYQQDPLLHRLHQLMPAPFALTKVRDRVEVLLEDRKGLKEFREGMKERRGRCDPRRVCAHVVRNLAWALSGTVFSSYEKASCFLLTLEEVRALHGAVEKCGRFMRQERDARRYDVEYSDTGELIDMAIGFLGGEDGGRERIFAGGVEGWD